MGPGTPRLRVGRHTGSAVSGVRRDRARGQAAGMGRPGGGSAARPRLCEPRLLARLRCRAQEPDRRFGCSLAGQGCQRSAIGESRNGARRDSARSNHQQAGPDGSALDRSASGHVTAVDRHAGTGDKAGFRPDQISHHGGDLCRAAHAPERDQRLYRPSAMPGTDVMSVTVGPGWTLLTVMPRGARSIATPRTSEAMAPLVIE